MKIKSKLVWIYSIQKLLFYFVCGKKVDFVLFFSYLRLGLILKVCVSCHLPGTSGVLAALYEMFCKHECVSFVFSVSARSEHLV